MLSDCLVDPGLVKAAGAVDCLSNVELGTKVLASSRSLQTWTFDWLPAISGLQTFGKALHNRAHSQASLRLLMKQNFGNLLYE